MSMDSRFCHGHFQQFAYTLTDVAQSQRLDHALEFDRALLAPKSDFDRQVGVALRQEPARRWPDAGLPR